MLDTQQPDPPTLGPYTSTWLSHTQLGLPSEAGQSPSIAGKQIEYRMCSVGEHVQYWLAAYLNSFSLPLIFLPFFPPESSTDTKRAAIIPQ